MRASVRTLQSFFLISARWSPAVHVSRESRTTRVSQVLAAVEAELPCTTPVVHVSASSSTVHAQPTTHARRLHAESRLESPSSMRRLSTAQMTRGENVFLHRPLCILACTGWRVLILRFCSENVRKKHVLHAFQIDADVRKFDGNFTAVKSAGKA